MCPGRTGESEIFVSPSFQRELLLDRGGAHRNLECPRARFSGSRSSWSQAFLRSVSELCLHRGANCSHCVSVSVLACDDVSRRAVQYLGNPAFQLGALERLRQQRDARDATNAEGLRIPGYEQYLETRLRPLRLLYDG